MGEHFIGIPASDDPNDLTVAEWRDLDFAMGDAVSASVHSSVMTLARRIRCDARAGAAREARGYCGCSWCCANNPPGVIPGKAHENCSAQRDRAAQAGASDG